jgi:hypothetical protein
LGKPEKEMSSTKGVAYQEEKAKGLVEALEYIADQITPPNLDRASDKAKQALAHYRQGQEKNDGR